MNDRQRARAEKLRAAGGSIRSIAADLDVTHYAVRRWLEEVTAVVPPPYAAGPKVLVYDIETAPTLAWVWSNFKTNIIATEQDWYVLSFAYKWLGEEETHFVSIFQDPNFVSDTTDDSYVVTRLLDLFNLADIVVAHNGDNFDQKKSQGRMLVHGLEPPSPYLSIDTLKESKKYFNLNSHSLNNLARQLGLDGKVQHTGFDLWRGCMQGDPDAWQVMERYNVHDVELLEQVYYKMMPWIGSPGKAMAANVAAFLPGESICTRPGCGGTEFVKDGWRYTKTGRYQSYKCVKCGGKTQSRKREPQAEDGGAIHQ